jgi:hypothetical protein
LVTGNLEITYENGGRHTFSLSRKFQENHMNLFDKICAMFAFSLGVVMVLLGVFGVFFGCHANFTLPAVIGILPAFFGWGVIRSVYFGWQFKKPIARVPSVLSDVPGSDSANPANLICQTCGYGLRNASDPCPKCGTVPRTPIA